MKKFGSADPRDYAMTEEELCGVLTPEIIEAAAKQAIDNFGLPDISGGLDYDEDLGMVHFKDKLGNRTLSMTIDAFNAWREADEL